MVEKELFEDFRIQMTMTRKRLGITQTQLAIASGIDQSNISKIENGIYNSVSIGTMIQIGSLLGISISKIVAKHEKNYINRKIS